MRQNTGKKLPGTIAYDEDFCRMENIVLVVVGDSGPTTTESEFK